jgi:hypothetical protein
MARSYGILIGALLTLGGVLGFVRGEVGITVIGISLEFSEIPNIVHIAIGLIGLGSGFAGGGYARAFARASGVIYTLVAVLGFARILGFAYTPDSVVTIPKLNWSDNAIRLVTMLNLNWSDNLIQLFVGLFGLLTGFTGSDAFIRARIKSYRRP